MDTRSQPCVSSQEEEHYKIRDTQTRQLLSASETFSRRAQVTQKDESVTCNFHDGLQPLRTLASSLACRLTVTPRRKSFSPKCSQDVTGSPFFIRKQSETESSGDAIPRAATQGAVPGLELPFPHRVGGPLRESGNSPWGEATHPSYRCGNYACQRQGWEQPATLRTEKIAQSSLERSSGWGAPNPLCWPLVL